MASRDRLEPTALASVPGGFVPGHDPRRAPGGVPKAIREARDALAVHLPRAVAIFGELLSDPDPRIRLAAAAEVADRTLGRPKPSEVDGDAEVRRVLVDVFASVRAKLDPADYRALVAAVADATK